MLSPEEAKQMLDAKEISVPEYFKVMQDNGVVLSAEEQQAMTGEDKGSGLYGKFVSGAKAAYNFVEPVLKPIEAIRKPFVGGVEKLEEAMPGLKRIPFIPGLPKNLSPKPSTVAGMVSPSIFDVVTLGGGKLLSMTGKGAKALGKAADVVSMAKGSLPGVKPIPKIVSGMKKAAPVVEKAVEDKPLAERTFSLPQLVKNMKEGKVPPAAPKPLSVPVGTAKPSPVSMPASKAMAGTSQTESALGVITKDVIKQVKSGKVLAVEKGQQISEAIAEGIRSGDLDGREGARFLGMELDKLGYTPDEIADNILKLKTTYGKGLSHLSRFAKEFRSIHAGNKKVLDALDGIPDLGAIDKFWDGYRYVDNIRRALMTSQIATTTRNMISQGGTGALEAFNSVLSSLEGRAFGKINTSQMIDQSMAYFISAYSALTKSGRTRIDKFIGKFPAEAQRLMRTPMGDVTMDQRLVRIVTTPNRLQEEYFRRMAFDARLRQLASTAGIQVKDATEAMVKESVDHALRMTYSAKPTSAPGKVVMYAYEKLPILTALGNPFPRFWLNAMRTAVDYSPAGLLKMSMKDLASNDPIKAYSAFNKAMMGTGMWSAGYAADRAGFTGERWYQLKVGDKNYDLRPYAPFTLPFFIGRLISRVEKNGQAALDQLDADDWTQAFLSMRRADASGLPILDAYLSKPKQASMDNLKEGVKKLVGNYLSGFSVPLRVVGDVTAQFSKEEALPRSTREEPVLGPTKYNFPGWKQTLPVNPPPFRSEPATVENPIVRQLTGMTGVTNTALETEADRLGIKAKDIFPKTDIKELDRLIVSEMGPLAEQFMTAMILRDDYKKLPWAVQRKRFLSILSNIRNSAKGLALQKNPRFQKELFTDKMNARRKRLGLNELGEPMGDEILPEGDVIQQMMQRGG